MNNYFGIGLDAKISLDFNNKRDEHPEKCRQVLPVVRDVERGSKEASSEGEGLHPWIGQLGQTGDQEGSDAYDCSGLCLTQHWGLW